MTESVFAVVGADGTVGNVIVADQEFIDALVDAIDDPDHDTGSYTADDKFFDVTGTNPRPGIGWTVKNKKFSEPVVPDPTPEELAAQQAAEQAAQSAADDAEFRTAMQDKLRSGGSLTQDERDRLLALSV